MDLLPASQRTEGNLLVYGATELEAVLLSTALARGSKRKVGRLFAPVFDLARLAEVPAFRQGKAPTVVIDFPAPALARQPEEVRRLLGTAVDLTWVSRHPMDAGEVEDRQGVLLIEDRDFRSRWNALAAALECPADVMDELEGILEEPPALLPSAEDAELQLSWHFALQAARAEPMYLGAVTKSLLELEPPDPDLVIHGRALVQELRDLEAGSTFHSFPTPEGAGVLIMAPQNAMGFYRDLAAEVREARGMALSILAFDSQDPIIVERSARPDDFEQGLARIAASLDRHVVRGFGASGFAVKGSETGSLEVLQKLIELLSDDAT